MSSEVAPIDGHWGGLRVRCSGFRFCVVLLFAEVHVSRRSRIRAVIGRDFNHFCGLFDGILRFVWKFSVSTPSFGSEFRVLALLCDSMSKKGSFSRQAAASPWVVLSWAGMVWPMVVTVPRNLALIGSGCCDCALRCARSSWLEVSMRGCGIFG